MKYSQILILILLTFSLPTISCRQDSQDNSIIEGDLFFRPFRYGSFYNQPDSLIKAFVAYADTAKIDNASSADKELLTTYNLLKKEHRLFSPFVELRVNDSSIIKLYLDSVDYDRIKIFKRQQLQAENKKIRVKAQCKEIANGLSICKKLISVDKINGLTMQQEKKMRIDDYE